MFRMLQRIKLGILPVIMVVLLGGAVFAATPAKAQAMSVDELRIELQSLIQRLLDYVTLLEQMVKNQQPAPSPEPSPVPPSPTAPRFEEVTVADGKVDVTLAVWYEVDTPQAVTGPVKFGTMYWGDGTQTDLFQLGCGGCWGKVTGSHAYDHSGSYALRFVDQQNNSSSYEISVGEGGSPEPNPPYETYTLDQVVSLTSEFVDPDPRIADEEYTLYTVYLSDGSKREVKVAAFGVPGATETAFRQSGYVGDVGALLALLHKEGDGRTDPERGSGDYPTITLEVDGNEVTATIVTKVYSDGQVSAVCDSMSVGTIDWGDGVTEKVFGQRCGAPTQTLTVSHQYTSLDNVTIVFTDEHSLATKAVATVQG